MAMRIRLACGPMLGLMLGLVAAIPVAFAQPAPPRPQQGQQRPPQAQPQQGPAFTLRNEGSRTLREFYASGIDQNDWGPDRLGADMVPAGQTYRIQLPRGANCVQDLRAVFDDDTSVERRAVNICQERTQAFRNPEPDAEVELVNAMPRTIFQLFLRPDQAGDEWGPDRLGSSVLSAGETETIRFSAGGQCQFDVRIVFDNDSAEERRAVDVCAAGRLVFRPGWTTDEAMPTDAGRAPGPGGAARPGRPPGPSAGPPDAPAGGTPAFRNAGTTPIVRLAVDPPGTTPPGPDRLGEAVIGPGASLVPALPPGLCRGDVVAQFRDGTSVQRGGVALCDGGEVSLP